MVIGLSSINMTSREKSSHLEETGYSSSATNDIEHKKKRPQQGFQSTQETKKMKCAQETSRSQDQNGVQHSSGGLAEEGHAVTIDLSEEVDNDKDNDEFEGHVQCVSTCSECFMRDSHSDMRRQEKTQSQMNQRLNDDDDDNDDQEIQEIIEQTNDESEARKNALVSSYARQKTIIGRCLSQPGRWLDDETINLATEYLQTEAIKHGYHVWIPSVFLMNTLLYNEKRIICCLPLRRWTRRRQLDLRSLEYILLPVNVYGCHWICMCADISQKRITVYDSLVNPVSQYRQELVALIEWITFEIVLNEHWGAPGLKGSLSEEKERMSAIPTTFFHTKHQEEKDRWVTIVASPQNVASPQGMPQQRNGSDCGMFVYCVCRDLAFQVKKWTFSQNTIETERQHLYDRLCRFLQSKKEEKMVRIREETSG
jgi:Ulp1 family protease